MTVDGDYLVLAATGGYRISIASAILAETKKLDSAHSARALSNFTCVDGRNFADELPGWARSVFSPQDVELIYS